MPQKSRAGLLHPPSKPGTQLTLSWLLNSSYQLSPTSQGFPHTIPISLANYLFSTSFTDYLAPSPPPACSPWAILSASVTLVNHTVKSQFHSQNSPQKSQSPFHSCQRHTHKRTHIAHKWSLYFLPLAQVTTVQTILQVRNSMSSYSPSRSKVSWQVLSIPASKHPSSQLPQP